MKTYIVLLRGINVGGNHILPMAALRTMLEKLGGHNVQSYIQSGNVVLQHPAENAAQLAGEIQAAILEQYGFDPHVLLLDLPELVQAVAANPFPRAEEEPKTVHLYFLTGRPPNPDWPMLENLQKENEQFQLIGRVFYLSAPDGIGRSKLAERVEKALGVVATARNWRTAGKILAMAQQLEAGLAGP